LNLELRNEGTESLEDVRLRSQHSTASFRLCAIASQCFNLGIHLRS
jgi:hypothetical protein